MKRRPVVLKHTTVPLYLLLPEVRTLLALALHANTHLLLNTLWHTGARISEALALTPSHFHLEGEHSYVSLAMLKGRGRPKTRCRGEAIARMVPIADPR